MIPNAPAADWTGESRGFKCGTVPDCHPLPEPWQTSGNAFHFARANPSRGWRLFPTDASPLFETTTQPRDMQSASTNAVEVESWIAAALAGAFGAFWVNRQVMEGVPQKPSPQF